MVIKADSLADLAKYKGTLQGKIVIYDIRANVERTFKPDAILYTDSALTEMANAKAQEARRAFDPNSPQMVARRKAFALRSAISTFLAGEKKLR